MDEENNVTSEVTVETVETIADETPDVAENPAPAQTKAKKSRRTPLIIAAALVLIAAIAIPTAISRDRAKRYAEGEEYLAEGSYAHAEEVFLDLGGYKDAAARAAYAADGVIYAEAKELMAGGDYTGAIDRLTPIAEFEDAAALIEECRNEIIYLQAKDLYEDSRFSEAGELFEQLGSYKDGADLALDCEDAIVYEQATELYEAGRFAEAKELFEQISTYMDAESMAEFSALAIVYGQAAELYEQALYTEAKELFVQAVPYGDAETMAAECDLQLGRLETLAALDAGEYERALELLRSDAGSRVEDREALIRTCEDTLAYREAEALLKDGHNYDAYQKFLALGDFSNAADRAKKCIVSYPRTGQTYRNPKYRGTVCALTIKPPADGTRTFFKIYAVSGDQQTLVSCIFIRANGKTTVRLPAGTYVFKAAYSSGNWFGPTDMFGPDGVYQRLVNSATSGSTFTLRRNYSYTLTLRTSTGDGNVSTVGENQNDF